MAHLLSRRSLALAVPAAASALLAPPLMNAAAAAPSGTRAVWREGEVRGPWELTYHGYGRVTDGVDRIQMVPMVSTEPGETHACLVTTVATYRSIDLTAYMRTDRQVRTGSAPNPWESAWLVWHYTDDLHFYALALKPNGWELSKEDPAYPGAQRYLATGSWPRYPVGSTAHAKVVQTGATIRVEVDGRHLTTFTDRERPYSRGRVGLYTEDAAVTFGKVRMFGSPLRSR